MSGHIVVSDAHHRAAKAVALSHNMDLGTWAEAYLEKNTEIQAELKKQQVGRK